MYDNFLGENIVGLEYQYINFENLFKANSRRAKRVVVETNGRRVGAYLDSASGKEAIRIHGNYLKESQANVISTIYNKIRKFVEMNEGDFVLIPSAGTNYLSFGVITSPVLHMHEGGGFTMYKNVRWIKRNVSFYELDSEYWRLKFTQHALSDVKHLSNHINQSVSPYYVDANGHTNLIFDVKKRSGIKGKELSLFLYKYGTLLELINEKLDLREDVSFEVQLNVQSPGKVKTTILNTGKAVGVAAALMAFPVGQIPVNNELGDKVEWILGDNEIRDTLMELEAVNRGLDMNRIDLQSIYK